MIPDATNALGNRSHAVRAQRSEPHDSLDDFPTPAWATRALCHYALDGLAIRNDVCWEPACNRGGMVRPLREFFREVIATDVHDYGCGYNVRDFLFPEPFSDGFANWIITNPPFRLAEQFAFRALDVARCGVALLVRAQFMESVGRYERLFSKRPPAAVWQFVERVPMVKGRLDRSASTATAYAWVVWYHGITDTRFRWIPPCRAQLDRDEDWSHA